MEKRGSYRSVQLRFASQFYVRRRWDAFERHIHMCVYIKKKKGKMQNHMVLLSIVHLKVKAHFSAVIFHWCGHLEKGGLLGLWLGSTAVSVPALSELPLTWCPLGEASLTEAVQGAVLEEEVGRGLLEALAKQDTSCYMGRPAYLTCLAGSVRMNDSFSMWGTGW